MIHIIRWKMWGDISGGFSPSVRPHCSHAFHSLVKSESVHLLQISWPIIHQSFSLTVVSLTTARILSHLISDMDSQYHERSSTPSLLLLRLPFIYTLTYYTDEQVLIKQVHSKDFLYQIKTKCLSYTAYSKHILLLFPTWMHILLRVLSMC